MNSVKMKKTILLLISVLMLAPAQVSAQSSLPEPVTISKDKIRIDGAVFYVHNVRQGQTLLSISKAYDVPVSDIEAHNPSASKGLKAGTFIYIPVNASAAPPASGKQDDKAGLSRAADEKAQQKSAPADRQKTKKEKRNKVRTEKPAGDDGQYKYRYRRSDGGGSSAAVPVSGPESAPQTAVVPPAESARPQESGKKEPEKKKPDESEHKDKVSDAADKSDHRTASSRLYDRNLTYTISLVLPFGKNAGSGDMDVNHADFYAGVLTALRDLREEKPYRKYRLEVYDLDKWESPVELLYHTAIGESDLIIGPVTPVDMAPVAEFARQKRIPAVSPLDIKTSSAADDNPYLFIWPTSAEDIRKRLMDKFTEDAGDCPLIVICEKGKEDSPLVSGASEALDSRGMEYTKYSYAILHNEKVCHDLEAVIPEENPVPARVFIASENEAFVADAMRNLNVLVTTNKRHISVYGMPKWRNFGSIQLEYLHHLNTRICLGYYIDYNSEQTMKMTGEFESTFNTSPTPYAYQGYDITRFFVESLEQYGPGFPLKVTGRRHAAIQSDILFMPKCEGGGFVNTAVRDIIYLPDWTVGME